MGFFDLFMSKQSRLKRDARAKLDRLEDLGASPNDLTLQWSKLSRKKKTTEAAWIVLNNHLDAKIARWSK